MHLFHHREDRHHPDVNIQTREAIDDEFGPHIDFRSAAITSAIIFTFLGAVLIISSVF